MTTSELYDFALSDIGRRRIIKEHSSHQQSRSYIFIEGDESCPDSTGCLCHAVTPEKEICRRKINNCPPTDCKKPIKMFGFCCPKCGMCI